MIGTLPEGSSFIVILMLLLSAKPIYRMWREARGADELSITPQLPRHSLEKIEDIHTIEIVLDAKILDKGVVRLDISQSVALDREHPCTRDIRLFLSKPSD